jgi:hypothetical protein
MKDQGISTKGFNFFLSTSKGLLENLVGMLGCNLFTYKNLWEWGDHPFETLPITPEIEQNKRVFH